MSDNKVVPFRRPQPKPSQTEIEMYRRMTRNWSAQMRELMFPMHAQFDCNSRQRDPE